ncbi:MAG TPA: hypothetical protein VHO69_05895, partial [Phototrophicaceae bacterium]|nr:hypothetical protein [Phototrophicaceae bacterium]
MSASLKRHNDDHNRCRAPFKTSCDEGYQSLWDAWNAVLPARQKEVVGAPWRQNPTFLEAEGWRPVS